MPELVQATRILTAAPEPSSPVPTFPGEGDLVAPAQNAARHGGALPPDLMDAVWRGNQLGGCRVAFVPTGFAALDAALTDGGWPCGCLIEVLQSQPSLIEWRLIGPSLRALVSGGRSVVVIGHPKRPHLVGLRHLGIGEDNLLWVKVDAPSHRLWATEQAIRSNAAAAVLAWMPQARPEQLRRLQVLAQGCEGPVFIIRPIQARHDPSPAPLRLLASPLLDWKLKVEVLKRRGAALESPLVLDSVPGGLEHVLTARTRLPSVLITSKEARRALGRPAHPASIPARIADTLASAASHR
ncbi:translesion DNA synthesis-associated protein ImuA [Pelomonas sp. Root1444]|uniref:translesion DNA synthesis-associated protein ImuA n=1 Tax=Pelomonas sp. Root1444 TaxID=1736464 RepID=UPI0012F862F5|nr:translesion DNA synthesis-associated protein ImuA [Pelomonas sp. Root1444]